VNGAAIAVGSGAAAEFLRGHLRRSPDVVLVLGSGLGAFADRIDDSTAFPFAEIPGFPRPTVAGHAGRLVAGTVEGVAVAALQGRFHLYEGWSAAEVVSPVRALAALGPSALVVTNAAGAARSGFGAGDLMLITDHLNFMFRNPLFGTVAPGEQRFPDMSDPYDPTLREVALETAARMGIPLLPGVYAAVLGPSYESPAEVRMLARVGADAIGMSTVPEVLVARALGLRVLGISCITNVAAGLGPGKLTHEEVLSVGEEAGERLAALLCAILPRLVRTSPGVRGRT
jgi:purine-nucleoside phosphorylase